MLLHRSRNRDNWAMIAVPRPLPVWLPLKARLVPALSTMAGSAVVLLPVVAVGPSMPPFGLLMLLAWRLLRPEMWPAWVALPLGLFDDLLSGQMLGTSMAIWTVASLIFDWIDHHLLWRDFWMEWALAALTILFAVMGGWAVSRSYVAYGSVVVAMPQAVLSVLVFPALVRLVAALDRWRLAR
jgi:rod shape-determining protein MreD